MVDQRGAVNLSVPVGIVLMGSIATRSENMKVIQVALAGFEERYVTL